jgi:hypothetical protein
VSFQFKLPDGSTEQIKLTASSTTPPPAGSFAIGANSTATATNLNAALNTAIGTLANTSLVAASAIAAGDNFFNTDGTATGSVANSKQRLRSPGHFVVGRCGPDSLATNFAAGDTITVNGTPMRSSPPARLEIQQRDRQRSGAAEQDPFDYRHLDAVDISGGVISFTPTMPRASTSRAQLGGAGCARF